MELWSSDKWLWWLYRCRQISGLKPYSAKIQSVVTICGGNLGHGAHRKKIIAQ